MSVGDALVVVVEVPGGSRNKYETDPETGHLFLDRTLFTATRYPADYGYFPETLADDGDELDALVLVTEPTFPGCRIRVRPVGVLWMRDEKGEDAKVLCVAMNDPQYGKVMALDDITLLQRAEIEHFFAIYKDLEPDKETQILGWEDAPKAVEAVKSAAEHHQARSRERRRGPDQP